MTIATAFVVAITKSAEWLGPAWSGLLTPFPIMTSILSAFTHHQQGWQASTRILRGLLAALFSFSTFLFMVSWLLPEHTLLLTYSLAALAAVVMNAMVFQWIK